MCDTRYTSKKDSLRNLKGVKSAKKIGNNTFYVSYKDGCNAIRLHTTDVVTFRPTGMFFINTGGWKTRTTKDRINLYLAYRKQRVRVFQKSGEWYVKDSLERVIPYYDYMSFNSKGELR